MRVKDILKVTGIPVMLASLCCLVPIVLVMAGIGTLSLAVFVTAVLDGRYRWAFDAVGLVTLAIAVVIYFRKRGICTLDQAKKHRNEIINKSLIFLVSGVVIYLIFFNGILNLIGKKMHLW